MAAADALYEIMSVMVKRGPMSIKVEVEAEAEAEAEKTEKAEDEL